MKRKLGAEAVGTFMLTLVAMGVDDLFYTGQTDAASRWVARGCIAAVTIYAFSEISGAHVNPAVTIGFALRRVFSWRDTAAYVAAQFVGAFAAAACIYALGGIGDVALGSSHPAPYVAPLAAVAWEALLSFVMMLTILTTANHEAIVGKQSALAVGLAIAACGFAGGALTGASMNPARTVAPQIISGHAGLAWIYIVGPLLGSAVAVGAHLLLCGSPNRQERRAARGKNG